jgi:NAD-dependent deacetylase
MDEIQLQKAIVALQKSRYAIAFTGAGISVESGVPSFRGENGIWSKYDPQTLELGFFYSNPLESWKVIREIFYLYFSEARANKAHIALAGLEEKGIVKCVITQNIDNLHQQAGSKTVHEFHGNSQKLVCTRCGNHYTPSEINFDILPPYCKKCDGLIKPDFIFFGENIPAEAYQFSIAAAGNADLVLVIGSTGEVMPAAQIPYIAKQNGAKIIEVNPEISRFTNTITDFYLNGKAGEIMEKLYSAVTGEIINLSQV